MHNDSCDRGHENNVVQEYNNTLSDEDFDLIKNADARHRISKSFMPCSGIQNHDEIERAKRFE